MFTSAFEFVWRDFSLRGFLYAPTDKEPPGCTFLPVCGSVPACGSSSAPPFCPTPWQYLLRLTGPVVAPGPLLHSMVARWPAWLCGKIKPKLVQKSFLRKSQDLHLDANPTTYAKAKFTQTRFPHTSSQVRNSSTLLDALSEVL